MSKNQPVLSRLKDIPRGIWVLGFVSLLMDISSEMIHALLPVYLVTVMGTSMVTVGIIEGIAEATASIVKVFSGVISDWIGKRKMLVVIGYGLAAFTKPVFPLAGTVGWLVAARFIDRIGIARRKFRPSSVTRCSGSSCRTAAGNRHVVADREQFPDRVLDRRHPGLHVPCIAHVCSE
jgi:MFS family permease